MNHIINNINKISVQYQKEGIKVKLKCGLEVCGIIYKITNKINGKVYIGQTTQEGGFDRRYYYDLGKNTHNDHLKTSIEKYGIDNFYINKEFDVAFSREELNIKEEMWISIYNATNRNYGYNYESGGKNFKRNKECKEKNRKAHEFQAIPIVQIDFNGKLIKEWIGAREASKCLNIEQSCIWNCINKKKKTYKGFIWVKKEEYIKNNKNVNLDYYLNNRGQSIKIVQLDKNYNLIKIWNSANEIMNKTNNLFDSSTIIKVCKHKYKSSKGYIFMYYDEYIHMQQ